MKIGCYFVLLVVLVGCRYPDEQPEVPQTSTLRPLVEVAGQPIASQSSSQPIEGQSQAGQSTSSVMQSSQASSQPSDWSETAIHKRVIQSFCVPCHSPGGAADTHSLLFLVGSDEQIEQQNLNALNLYSLDIGAQWLIEKAIGEHGHGGGQQITKGSEFYTIFADYLEVLTGESFGREVVATKSYKLESPTKTYRRASLLLTGQIPSVVQLANVQGADDKTLRLAIVELMRGAGFKDFLKRGANDQLLVRSLLQSKSLRADFQYYYPVFRENYFANGYPDLNYLDQVIFELAEAPLELIAYVVLNDRPYGEILKANYSMVSERTSQIYKTDVSPSQGEFLPAINQGQHVSGTDKKYPYLNWELSHAITVPHAGVLTEPSFLQQYPTTATNRNRARSNWVSKHFLGFNIEDSVARTISNTALLNSTNNPTLNNDACSRCHMLIDPIAGAFKNFAERGIFNANAGGMDSLDDNYKSTQLYTDGDSWYADMLPAGFNGAPIISQNASIQALANLMTTDSRFNSAAVKFWWPALFGETMFDDDLSGLPYQLKLQTLGSLASNFEENNHNLRQLLADMVMSDWFRIDSDMSDVEDEIAIKSGGRRLLTPEELANKTLSVTGVFDEHLTTDINVLFGGIDSFNTTERQRRLNTMMLRAAERHALSNACNIVVSEFKLPAQSRKLFTEIEPYSSPSAAYAEDVIFNTMQPQILEFPIAIQASPAQRISYVLSSTTDTFDVSDLNNVEIYDIEIIAPNGDLVLKGNARLLYRENEWVTGTPAGAWNGPIKLRNGFELSLSVPAIVSGTYTLRLSLAAVSVGNHLNITMHPKQLFADATDAKSVVFRHQMAQLIERMHGKLFAQDSPEVLAYTELFIELRKNKITRGSHINIIEPGLRCGYEGGAVPTSVWGADSFYNLSAWRGVIVSLMSDFNYLYE